MIHPLLNMDNAAYLEALYEQYLADPNSVDPNLRAQFDAFPPITGKEEPHSPIQQAFLQAAKHKAHVVSAPAPVNEKYIQVLQLVDAYRRYGHFHATVDPLALQVQPVAAQLTLAYHQLTESDLKTVFSVDVSGHMRATLGEIIHQLQTIYCSDIGSEFMYMSNDHERDFIMHHLENDLPNLSFSDQRAKYIYRLLNQAEGLERYLHNKYVGQKRFSLEGGDSLIPCIDEIIQRAGMAGAKEVIIGMAHRGRLNVLINILGKAPRDLFKEFEGKAPIELLAGDVKYHQGFSSDIDTPNGVIHLALGFNPSHLEIVTPVVEGSVKARQEGRHDRKHESVVPIAIHGDSAFAGQGVVMETLNMSQVRGFNTGGTIHIVVNNQVGFTTSNPRDTRSTAYCTDIAKMLEAPVFHVNGDSPESVVYIARLALAYRMQFKKDVVIDLVCYRRHGHNEADEPAATQPLMYQKIQQHPTITALYGKRLIDKNVMTADEMIALEKAYRDHLDTGEHIVETLAAKKSNHVENPWASYTQQDMHQAVDTGVEKATLVTLAEKLFTLPPHFVTQKQVGKVIEDRQKMAKGDLAMDWGFAENLAYASLLHEGYGIRLTGQDSGRGTFAHRHAVLHDQATGTNYCALAHLEPNQPHFLVTDSLLSEEAVLAFEYGYSTTDPKTLVLWEAQFGDFANGAQVVIDQFISSGEHKWGRYSALVLLLPHGYEGMGPEHSSARLERYLQLCAENNMFVCVPSTPAQAFHMLRRQMLAPYRKPLIVMTPKSLLRHKLAVSTLDELAQGEFQTLIPEIDQISPEKVKRVVMCSGKVYYDLLIKRREKARDDISIIRVEQLYPFPEAKLRELLAQYVNAKSVVWCQEEPQNQGAWYSMRHHMEAALLPTQTLSYVGRVASSSPAAGYHSMHVAEQNKLVEDAIS